MFGDLDNPAFQDDDLAREWFEVQIWPDGPVCTHCGATGEGQVTRMFGKKHRAGCFQCNACRGQFTVTTGTVMERSHIGLHILAQGDVSALRFQEGNEHSPTP